MLFPACIPAPSQDAVIAALKAVREELPVKLGEQLHDHVHTELFSDDRLFLYFK